tara:strand:+ start:1102 stop:1785 length:684 start_codon:yes stop_codon:yes gene_type:complete
LTKRLSEGQKKELVENFKSGKSIDVLSKEFDCTKSTISRNLKKILGDIKYQELIQKNKTSKEKNIGKKKYNNILLDKKTDDEVFQKDLIDLKNSEKNRKGLDFVPLESFIEIAPIDYEMDNSSRPELSSVPILEIDFPKVVYMIVDKKIELETKPLKDYAEWQFLSLNELNRKTIQIFDDLKNAKRFCSKDQKVIKVPNTDVFKIVAPILVSRGISRIVSGDKLIAL